MKRLLLYLFAGLSLAACAPAEFNMYGDDNTQVVGIQTPAGNPDDTNPPGGGHPPLTCDANDPANVIPAVPGLKGNVYYLTSGQPQYNQSSDYIKYGTKVNLDFLIDRVYVPTRYYQAGLVTETNVAARKDNGQLLLEWFGLDVESHIKLGPDDTPGDYQFAILSDDGSTLYLENADGDFESIITSEGLHSPKLACANKVVNFQATTRLPMNLTYFQGPCSHIALIILWRKIIPGMSLSETECGKAGNDYFFSYNSAQAKSVPQSPYLNMLQRGWKPLTKDNYEYKTAGNKCSTSSTSNAL